MENIQQASPFFFLPVAAAYLLACGLWLLLTRFFPALWPWPALMRTDRKYLDFALVLVGVTGILLFGQLYRAGWLLPTKGAGWGRELAWMADNLVIYSPIFLILLLRRQSAATIYLSGNGFFKKVLFGIGLGLFAVFLFLILRGEAGKLPEILTKAAEPKRLANFLPVFLEGVALAFGFVRLRWAFGLWPALLLPALLFAAAHVPGQIEEGRTAVEIVAFFVFNSGLVAAILYVAQKSQDIIWLGIVHYLMDVAIQAF